MLSWIMGQGSPGGNSSMPGGYQPEPGDPGRGSSFDDDGTWGNASKPAVSMSVPGFTPSPGISGGAGAHMTAADRADALAARLGQPPAGGGWSNDSAPSGHQAPALPTFQEALPPCRPNAHGYNARIASFATDYETASAAGGYAASSGSAAGGGGGGGGYGGGYGGYNPATELAATDYGISPPSQGSGTGWVGGSLGSGMGVGGGYGGGSQGYGSYGAGGSDNGYGGGYGGGSSHGSFSLSHGTGAGPGNLNVTQAAGADKPPPAPPRDPVREAWGVGTVVECLSTSAGRWYVSQITDVDPQTQVMTVQFTGDDGTLKQKSMYRTDAQLSPLGLHTRGELPPGFQAKDSQSRAGQVVYFDGITGKKYASPELAWQVHFERLLARPASVGCETVFAVPPKPNAGPPSHAHMAPSHAPMAALHDSRHASMESQPPVSLDALARMGVNNPPAHFQPGTHGALGQHGVTTPSGYGPAGGHTPPGGLAPAMNYGPPPGGYEQAAGGHSVQAQAATDAATGKHSLPKFGDQLASNQSAYLSYVGASADGVAPPPFAQGSQAADGFQPTRAYYGSPDESGFQPSGPRPVVRNPRAAANPAMHAWQQDPFSEWRR